MNVLRFLHQFTHDGSQPGAVAIDLSRRPALSRRPGMHQLIEDLDGTPFTTADHELLHQMGICMGIKVVISGPVDNSPIDGRGENVGTGISAQPDFSGGKVSI